MRRSKTDAVAGQRWLRVTGVAVGGGRRTRSSTAASLTFKWTDAVRAVTVWSISASTTCTGI